ncbi:MAG: NPCBM/NEW2 domain-containing protein, partial [Candidatus Omnitrophica bacterium]|nr:NPCBM/NEW2 domain-containing protein [Candidatus Omnitrophota bacterium]
GIVLVQTNTNAGASELLEYLSDRPDLFSVAAQGWGVLGIDTAAHLPDAEPMTLQIKDRKFHKGLGSHAPGQVVVELDGMYEAFEAEVGVQWQGGQQGSVVFKVIADGREVFDSGVMRETTPAKRIRLSVKGVQELRLAASDAGDGITCDVADWVEARLVPDALAQAEADKCTVDIAPFGQVLTWDPERMDGARNGRTEEVRVEDLFLGTEIAPDTDGFYAVPQNKNGMGCIGLRWLEKRRVTRLELRFADASMMPTTNGVQVQCWIAGEQGGSRWQGRWEPMKGLLQPENDRWVFTIDWRGNPVRRAGVMKVRWILPGLAKPVLLRGLSAYTDSRWDDVQVRLRIEKPMPGKQGRVEVYNGEAVGAGEWNLVKPLNLEVRYSRSKPYKGDRTVLRIKLPEGAFGVAIEDLLTNDCVYVKDFGLFATREPDGVTLDAYKSRIAERKTVLDRVRSMPDQTLEQAMKALHRPEADLGPTMLSLACDNHKFILSRSGQIEFDTRPEVYNCFDRPYTGRYCCRFAPEFGSGKGLVIERHLEGGWLPIPVISFNDQGVVYRQRTFVAPYDKSPPPEGAPAWLNRKPLCVAEITVENPLPQPAKVSLKLRFIADIEKSEPAPAESSGEVTVFLKSGQPVAIVGGGSAKVLRPEVKDGLWSVSGELPAGTLARWRVCIPGWAVSANEIALLTGNENLVADTEAYWRGLILAGMRIEIPDPLLANLIYASEVHCMLASRNEDGVNVAPWISSFSYGPLESEANSIVRGMQVMGQTDFARRSLDYFIKRYNRAGYLTTGYTVMGTGWHLWTLGEYYALARDTNWLRTVAPEIERVCHWVMAQRDKTRKLNARGEPVPEYGLMPPGVMADWPVYAYYACLNGYYAAGLRTTGEALADIGYPGHEAITTAGKELAKAIMRGFHWAQSLSPVFPLQDGTWVPEYPTQIFCHEPVEDLYQGEDYGRSWCYDVEISAHHLIPFGIMNPRGRDAGWMMDHMEDVQFLKGGWHYYSAEQ